MTIAITSLGLLNQPFQFPPRWYSQRYTPYVNEGDPISIGIWCLNPIPGAQVQVWFTGGNSLAGDGNYVEGWHTVLARACAAVGCTYTPNGGSPYPHGTLCGLIVCGPAYNGETIVATAVTRKNRRTDASPIYGGPGYREMQLLIAGQAGVNGLTDAQAGSVNSTVGDIPDRFEPDGTKNNVARNVIRLYDTSKRPAGSPTLQLAAFAGDGVSAIGDFLEDGDEIVVKVLTANFLPGTQIKLYAANDAQQQTSPGIREAIPPAAVAAHCTYTKIEYSEATKDQWFRGVTVNYEPEYSDTNPVSFKLTVKRPVTVDGTPQQQFDLIALVVREGTANDMATTNNKGDYDPKGRYVRGDYVRNLNNGAQYIWISEGTGSTAPPNDDTIQNAVWRLYDPVQVLRGYVTKYFRDAAPRFWEARAIRNADGTLTYTIHSPIKDAGGASVVVSEAGTAQITGFVPALAAAAAAHPTFTYDPATGRLASTATVIADADLTFTIPPVASGKHIVVLSASSTASPITIGEACVFMTQPALPADPANVYGVNVCGGEFSGNGDRYGTDYRYPADPSDPNPAVRYEEFDYQWSKGARALRLPVKWERIQRVLFSDLSGTEWPGAVGVFPSNTAMDMLRIDDCIANWLARGPDAIVIFDLHNYMAYHGDKVGYDQPVPMPALNDVWIKIATRYGSNPRVWFDTMNEPSGNGQQANRCRENFQWLINVIRGRTDALNKILIEGQLYSSSRYWVNKGQAAEYSDFHDPVNNFAFSPHCYLDSDASGTATECALDAGNRLYDMVQDARANGYRFWVGEIGFSAASSCAATAPATLKYIRDNKDVIIGFSAWASGRRWGGEQKYAYAIDPQDYLNPVDSGPMKILAPYLNN
ncbi:cellulase family glycosylhydrolase [Sphingomonas sp. BAUL-RG-20F-R05-02]|uniref:cellulase family glycosylhydrolase n=1 Tax=Sphingomonas sp. BAUL-RG-20F-R05-02 TaxID=2914830 RepID=UPI001F59CA24|nr:cellulase family glycosylhydrolase [Sphingomonas sp. BAUL-RG-20F-R05-02]